MVIFKFYKLIHYCKYKCTNKFYKLLTRVDKSFNTIPNYCKILGFKANYIFYSIVILTLIIKIRKYTQ